jgi:predicted DNA-binding transcriptional regulator AlpA
MHPAFAKTAKPLPETLPQSPLQTQQDALYPIMRLPDVMKMLRFGKTKIYDMINHGDFPRPLKFGRSSRWLRAEVVEWIAQCAQQRTPSDENSRQTEHWPVKRKARLL